VLIESSGVGVDAVTSKVDKQDCLNHFLYACKIINQMLSNAHTKQANQ